MAKYYYDKYTAIGGPWNEPPIKYSQGGSMHQDRFSELYKTATWSPPAKNWILSNKWGPTYMAAGMVGYDTRSTSRGLELLIITVTSGSSYAEPTGSIRQEARFANEATPGTYTRGSLVQSNILAENGTYPTNGRSSLDGYWYVRGSAYAPANKAPLLTLSTTNNRTLYENDTYNIVGNSKDEDAGNAVIVKYQINGGTTRNISTAISTGAEIPFSKTLVFRNKRLYDGDTAVTADLLEGAQHTLKVWAEDDQGGKSTEVTRTFQVVANRAPILTINPLANKSDLINTDTIVINGTVSDPDGNTVKVDYKVGSGSYAEIYDGAGGDFAITLPLSALKVGNNAVAVRATDSYGAVTTRNLNFAKTENLTPLKESVRRYKINPPNREAKGVVLWVERDVGDLIVSAEISMTGNAEDESFEPMTLNSTAFVSATREEDEFQYEASEVKEKIILKLTMVRASLDSDQGIRLISGVLS